MIALVEFLKAIVFIAVVGWLFYNLGQTFPRKRRLSLQQIAEERSRIENSFPPQFVAQFDPKDFQMLVEERLRTYLEHGGPYDPKSKIVLFAGKGRPDAPRAADHDPAPLDSALSVQAFDS